MKNSGATKTYLALAALLAIAEILLMSTGNGKLPISGLILFAFFFALALSAQKSEKFKGIGWQGIGNGQAADGLHAASFLR